eukprot:6482486-Amphidinium_carterae.1
MHVHLVGSDVRTRPSHRTIVVFRQSEGKDVVSYWDMAMMAGTCTQSSALGSSSTDVRSKLVAGTIPEEYGGLARQALASLLNLAVVNVSGTAASSMTSCSSVQPTSQTLPLSSQPAIAKAMPKKRAGAPRVAVQLLRRPSDVLPDERPSLKRRCVLPNAAASTDGAFVQTPADPPSTNSRPPLPRRMGVHALPPVGEPLPCGGMPVAPEVPAVSTSNADRLLVPAVLKFAAPLYSHLGTFARCVIAPVARLFRIVPLSVVRRNGDAQIRVPYVPAATDLTPLSVCMNGEQFEELRSVLGLAVFTGYYYVAMAIGSFTIADKDTDSVRGMAVKHAFCSIATFFNEHLTRGTAAFSVALYESHHF